MNNNAMIENLRGKIVKTILPLMTTEVIIVDAPYYGNIGDVLIWQGIKDFFDENNIKIKGIYSVDTFKFVNIEASITIVLTGGGNFGDLYRFYHEFRLKIIQHYPHNKIVVMPQSVYYKSSDFLAHDVQIVNSHRNLSIIARDQVSYNFMREHFTKTNILIAPDMAFYISDTLIDKYRATKPHKDTICLFREDKESVLSLSSLRGNGFDICDWPTIGKVPSVIKGLDVCYRVARKLRVVRLDVLVNKLCDRIANIFIRKSFVHQGCKLLSDYKSIYSTRLHGMILGILLDKDVVCIDNSTGKISAFYNTWLTDLDSLRVK